MGPRSGAHRCRDSAVGSMGIRFLLVIHSDKPSGVTQCFEAISTPVIYFRVVGVLVQFRSLGPFGVRLFFVSGSGGELPGVAVLRPRLRLAAPGCLLGGAPWRSVCCSAGIPATHIE